MRNADDMGIPPADAVEKLQAVGRERQVRISYTNHRGEYAERVIQPREMWFGKTVWHPGEQWFVIAHDVEKDATRYFAIKDIDGWIPA